jgi:hypothetical protein
MDVCGDLLVAPEHLALACQMQFFNRQIDEMRLVCCVGRFSGERTTAGLVDLILRQFGQSSLWQRAVRGNHICQLSATFHPELARPRSAGEATMSKGSNREPIYDKHRRHVGDVDLGHGNHKPQRRYARFLLIVIIALAAGYWLNTKEGREFRQYAWDRMIHAAQAR